MITRQTNDDSFPVKRSAWKEKGHDNSSQFLKMGISASLVAASDDLWSGHRVSDREAQAKPMFGVTALASAHCSRRAQKFSTENFLRGDDAWNPEK